jgi:hypothetical protein
VQLVVKTAAQKIMIHVGIEQLLKLSINLKSAIHQARKNAKSTGQADLVEAIGVNSFLVGHAQGVGGVLLVIDGDLPTETVYSVPLDIVVGMGKLLMAEGQKRLNIKRAISPKHKLILPGG